MNARLQSVAARRKEERILVLQGGGALGAYQAGVYETLAAAGQMPHWVAGISIGAANAALIAGNPPERRVQRLHEFWDTVTSSLCLLASPLVPSVELRSALNEANVTIGAVFGLPGFFVPRFPAAPFQLPGTTGALSFYDTGPLRATPAQLVDFDLLNRGSMRLSVGAVNVRTGNFAYFDTAGQRLDARHIMASGALPPGLLVSNAGIQIIHPLEAFPFADWKRLLAIHLDGAFLTTKACLPHMYASGRGGSVIYMGSVRSKEGSVLKAPYVTAKHGLIGLAEVVAKEGAAHGVRANVICPGFVRTPGGSE